MRVLVVWCPDWPVVAAAAEEGLRRGAAVAVLAHNQVLACNELARREGVRRGMRRRDAQSRCPGLTLLAANPDRDARAFEPVLAAVEELRPGVAPLRPGLLAIRSPGRFYGGDTHAAAVLAERLVELGVWDVRIGIADDLFTAEQAARRADVQDCVVVPEGGSPAFLGGLPIAVLDDAELVGLLRRLGLRLLGDLAALPARDVLTRFGAYGAKVHRLASGADRTALATRRPPPELACEVDFEPPLESVETVCFSVRRTAERFVAQLAGRELVATAVAVEATTERGTISERCWVHSRWFGSADLVDRVHWQLQGADLDGPVSRVRFVPEAVEPAGVHAEALWGAGTDDRVERGIARVQALLGYDAAVRPVRQGGRSPADRQALVPWGERAGLHGGLRPRELPWPGSIPSPAPTRVFAEPRPAAVVGEAGQPIRVSDRGRVNSPPVRFRPVTVDEPDAGWQSVVAWAGPWPVDEQWWEQPAGQPRCMVARFQLVGADGRAWLLRCEVGTVGAVGGSDVGGWWTEASYD